MSAPPRVILLTGEGKGKTTSALGMALRACGHGKRVTFVQFIKDASPTGEARALRHLPGVTHITAGRGFIFPGSDLTLHRHAAAEGLAAAREALAGNPGMVILDEICTALSLGLLNENELFTLIDTLPPDTILILTGRDATPALIEKADTVSRIHALRHAYDQGRPAQPGVEY